MKVVQKDGSIADEVQLIGMGVPKANKVVSALSVPVIVPAGGTIYTDIFDVSGYDFVYVRLRGNASNWKIEMRTVYDPNESGNFSPQTAMRSPSSFTNNSNTSQGYLAVNSPYAKLAILNQGTSDAQVEYLDIFVQ